MNWRRLVEAIGIPGRFSPSETLIDDPSPLFELARQNKIPLLFLQKIDSLKEKKQEYEEKLHNFLALLRRVADIFRREELDYALFKTLKPFSYVPTDIDVLVRTKKEFLTACRILQDAGLDVLEKEHYEMTLYSSQFGVNVDLYLAINVVDFTYLHKERLLQHTYVETINGNEFRTLKPYAELIAVATHSLYKEQLFTLNDFYTFLSYQTYIPQAESLAKATHSVQAFHTILRLVDQTLTIAKQCHKRISEKQNEDRPVGGEQLSYPYHFRPIRVLPAFLEKLGDRHALTSLPFTAQKLFHPQFYRDLISHTTRKTY